MPLKPSLRAICHYRALSAFTVYNRGGGRNSSVLSGFFWPSVGLLARTAGKSLKPWLLVNEGGLSTVPCCWFAIRIATRDSSRFVGNPYLIALGKSCPSSWSCRPVSEPRTRAGVVIVRAEGFCRSA